MDEVNGVVPTDMLTKPACNNPSWTTVVPLPPELMRCLNMLADEIGAVNPDAPILGPVVLGELGLYRKTDSKESWDSPGTAISGP